MSKIFDNIETKFEEGLHAIPESADRAGLLKVGNMSFNEFSDRCKGRENVIIQRKRQQTNHEAYEEKTDYAE